MEVRSKDHLLTSASSTAATVIAATTTTIAETIQSTHRNRPPSTAIFEVLWWCSIRLELGQPTQSISSRVSNPSKLHMPSLSLLVLWLLWSIFPPLKPAPPAMPPPDDGFDQVLLNFIEHNPSGKSTVLLIHGACTSGPNWDLVVPHLADTYHLLVPDLPGHGQSQNVTPFSAEYSSRLLER